jgi:hypothetical protein
MLGYWVIIHTYYQNFKAIIDIATGEVTEGALPSKQAKLVLAWTEIHKEELMANWQLASNGELPYLVEPLK